MAALSRDQMVLIVFEASCVACNDLLELAANIRFGKLACNKSTARDVAGASHAGLAFLFLVDGDERFDGDERAQLAGILAYVFLV